ncbi:MAG: hypothetical protein HQL66_07365 [Magnetococcales bacterium]|nr:hypothetical protein [Magnetococcales bacterium]
MANQSLIVIEESGMNFGLYPIDNIFHIEKSNAYAKVSGRGVKMAEFLLLRCEGDCVPEIWIVEAKSSTGAWSELPKEFRDQAFLDFIRSIRDKFANSLTLGISMRVGRHGQPGVEQLPASFQKLNLVDAGKARVRFVLAIQSCGRRDREHIREALTRELRPLCAMWSLPPYPAPIAVVDVAGARELGLVI